MRRFQQYSDQINMYYSRLVIQVLFSTLLAAANLATADTKRAGNWEGTFQVIGNMSESTNGEQGSSLDVDSEIGFGFAIGYNINSRFALNMWRIEIGRIF